MRFLWFSFLLLLAAPTWSQDRGRLDDLGAALRGAGVGEVTSAEIVSSSRVLYDQFTTAAQGAKAAPNPFGPVLEALYNSPDLTSDLILVRLQRLILAEELALDEVEFQEQQLPIFERIALLRTLLGQVEAMRAGQAVIVPDLNRAPSPQVPPSAAPRPEELAPEGASEASSAVAECRPGCVASSFALNDLIAEVMEAERAYDSSVLSYNTAHGNLNFAVGTRSAIELELRGIESQIDVLTGRIGAEPFQSVRLSLAAEVGVLRRESDAMRSRLQSDLLDAQAQRRQALDEAERAMALTSAALDDANARLRHAEAEARSCSATCPGP